MTNFVIIGGRSGLGQKITKHYNIQHVLGRPQFDISTTEGREEISKETIRLAPNVIILNSFDHKVPSAQEATLRRLWVDFENQEVTFIVISSTARAWAKRVKSEIFRSYCEAKASLSEACLYLSWKSIAKIVLIEPSSVENIAPWHVKAGRTTETYLTYSELLETIDIGLQLSKTSQFVTLTRSGLHQANEFTNAPE